MYSGCYLEVISGMHIPILSQECKTHAGGAKRSYVPSLSFIKEFDQGITLEIFKTAYPASRLSNCDKLMG